MILATADDAMYSTIVDCFQGEHIETTKDSSYEVLNYTTGMTNPRARIVTNPHRPLNIVTAVARFVWLVGGNNRVEDIAFYEPKVRGFSDNGVTVPGSCYGARLFGAPTGYVNQIKGVIDRLRNEPGSRQAAAVVWLPEDAVRPSADIPCTFGMFFHVRNDELHMTTTMRSNNAFRILPFNLFEFSLLQEVVAAELCLSLGQYTHWAASMHVYDNSFEMPVTEAVALHGPGDSIVMPSIPVYNVLHQISVLVKAEAQLRHVCNKEEFNGVLTWVSRNLNSYWLGLFGVLVAWHAAKRAYGDTVLVPEYLVGPTNAVIGKWTMI